ncbi:Conserved hypothetical protein CHP00275,flavoprotein HI0933-like [Moorella glycerini]|uniref:Tricarballylate dehydrogenase n=2 Tax=Neomoorella stamsii TaxID=1266720 RepID=A0A9X7J3V3_9FIRM|nr:tricarballylate dehydrogenase [Moorella stamsii]CEP67413.1 Conserved hypothetical protein CHP00275,flavoprotein HI0933-like [Moorella glycerini]
MMAALAAAGEGARVILLERNDKLGKKLLLTGGGRCNLTNDSSPAECVSNIPGNGKFLYSTLNGFPPARVREFFASLGVPTVVEEEGRVFPASGRSGDVVRAMARALEERGAEIYYATRATGLLLRDGRCSGVVTRRGKIYGRGVIVATGGLSYPATGSTGDGYDLARQAGHHIVGLRPSLVPLESPEGWIRDSRVQGISLKGAGLTLLAGAGRKRVKSIKGDVLFTHFGLSGPGILCLSRHLDGEGNSGPWELVLDFFPGETLEELAERCLRLATGSPARSVKNLLDALLPGRLVPEILARAGINPEGHCGQAGRKGWRQVARVLKGLNIRISGTRPVKEAMVTAGGVDVREVDPRTMASRLVPGLYFAGEVLDVDGYTGGYNLQIAFATGWAAGKGAAMGQRNLAGMAGNHRSLSKKSKVKYWQSVGKDNEPG